MRTMKPRMLTLVLAFALVLASSASAFTRLTQLEAKLPTAAIVYCADSEQEWIDYAGEDVEGVVASFTQHEIRFPPTICRRSLLDPPMSPSDVRRRCSITSGRTSPSSRRTRASWTASPSSRCATCYGTTGRCQRESHSRCTCRRGADMSHRPRSTKVRARSSSATRSGRTEM